jgi:hypothetical protein
MKLTQLRIAVTVAAFSVCARAQVFYTVENNTDTLYTVDVSTFSATPVGPLGVSFLYGDLAFDPATATMFMSDGWGAGLSVSSSLYTVDLTTGAATLVGSMGVTSVFALAYDPTTSKLYGATSTIPPYEFVEIDRATGAATVIGSPGHSIDGMTYVGSNGFIVGLEAGVGLLHVIDPANGVAAPLFTVGTFVNNCGAAWSASNDTIYGLDVSGALCSFDVANFYARQDLWTFHNKSFDGLAGAGLVVPTNYCTAGTTTNGCNASIGGSGNASATAGSGFNITVSNVEGQKAGIIFYGINNTGFAPTVWGSGGTSYLCAKAPLQRTPLQNSGGTFTQCDGVLSIDWNAFRASHPTALGNPFTAGHNVFAQGWFRDPPAVRSTNLSDGLQFAVGP